MGQCGRSSRVEFDGLNDLNGLYDLEWTICESKRSRDQTLIGLHFLTVHFSTSGLSTLMILNCLQKIFDRPFSTRGTVNFESNDRLLWSTTAHYHSGSSNSMWMTVHFCATIEFKDRPLSLISSFNSDLSQKFCEHIEILQSGRCVTVKFYSFFVHPRTSLRTYIYDYKTYSIISASIRA